MSLHDDLFIPLPLPPPPPRPLPAPVVEAGEVDGVTDEVKGESKLLVLLGEEKGSGNLRPG